jgi:hypothetical protein
MKFNIYNQMVHALKNELSVDKNDYFRLYNGNSRFIPLRPISSTNKIKNIAMLKIIHFIITLFWIIIFPVMIIYKSLKYIFLIKNKNNFDITEKSIIVATSHRIQDLYTAIDDECKPSQWLLVPWVKISKVKFKKSNYIDSLSLLNMYDIVLISYRTMYGAIKWLKHINYPTEALQSYVLFEYFMLERILIKLDQYNIDEYWYSNHYDRWSVLLDSDIKKNNVLIQHGMVGSEFILPYKLYNIKKVYLLNLKSLKDFKDCIIDKNTKFTYEIQKSTLKLSKINNYSNSILIIGSPSKIKYDIILALELLKNEKLFVYVKPHPCFENKDYIMQLSNYSNCTVIQDNTFYPKVRLAISDYSTLAYEYHECGIKILWRPESDNEDIIQQVFLKILKNKIYD